MNRFEFTPPLFLVALEKMRFGLSCMNFQTASKRAGDFLIPYLSKSIKHALSLSRYPGILISLYERNSFFFLRRWIEESRCILRLTQVTSLEANPSAVSLERQAADLLAAIAIPDSIFLRKFPKFCPDLDFPTRLRLNFSRRGVRRNPRF